MYDVSILGRVIALGKNDYTEDGRNRVGVRVTDLAIYDKETKKLKQFTDELINITLWDDLVSEFFSKCRVGHIVYFTNLKINYITKKDADQNNNNKNNNNNNNNNNKNDNNTNAKKKTSSSKGIKGDSSKKTKFYNTCILWSLLTIKEIPRTFIRDFQTHNHDDFYFLPATLVGYRIGEEGLLVPVHNVCFNPKVNTTTTLSKTNTNTNAKNHNNNSNKNNNNFDYCEHCNVEIDADSIIKVYGMEWEVCDGTHTILARFGNIHVGRKIIGVGEEEFEKLEGKKKEQVLERVLGSDWIIGMSWRRESSQQGGTRKKVKYYMDVVSEVIIPSRQAKHLLRIL